MKTPYKSPIKVVKPIGLLVVSAVLGSVGFACLPQNLTGQNTCSSLSNAPKLASKFAVPATPMTSHIPSAVRKFSDQGKMSESNSLSVTVSLQLNNEADLDQYLAKMYRPGIARAEHFMTPAEFKSKYAPSEDQVESVRAFFADHGMTAAGVDANGYLMHVEGSVSAWNTALQTEIHQFKDSKGKSFYAPSSEPTLPAGLGIQAVHGLHNLGKLHSLAHKQTPLLRSSPNGSGPGGGMSPGDILSVYQFPSSATGAGQTLALVELDGYDPGDVAQYASSFNLPSVPLNNVLIDDYDGTAGEGASEVTLDIELAMAVAPGLAGISVYEAPNSSQSFLDIYSQIAADNTASTVSISWGSAEDETDQAFLQSENTILKQLAAQGISVFVAAGDSGAYTDGASLSVSDPAAQPFVTAVGGTSLSFSNGRYISESTWNGGSVSNGAGGGGISSVWTQPSWQAGISASGNSVSTSMRNVPDVSLNADPQTGYAVYFQGAWQIFGGTSCAAPIWAGFTALVNHSRAATGSGNLGFANTAIYSLAATTNYLADFHDITDGSTNLFYPATKGYDDATGWGTINGTQLFQDLIAQPPADPVSATSNDTVTCS